MLAKQTIKHALVVISPDLINIGAPRQSPLLARALNIAKATGCKLELLHVCYEPALEQELFRSDADVAEEKQRLLERETALLAQIADRLKSAGATVSHDVLWDHPRSEVILNKIDECVPDLVLKVSRNHDITMGISRTTDWDLIRQSTAPVWFVTDTPTNLSNIVTAISLEAHSDSEQPSVNHSDHAALELATELAACFKARNHPVHAFQAPVDLDGNQACVPAPGLDKISNTRAPKDKFGSTRTAIVRTHSKMIRAFAESVDLDAEDIQLREGSPSDVLPQFAQDVNADLIVMGARYLTRWEQLVSPVTAEPVLAKTPCDVLFVKDSAVRKAPVAALAPLLDTTTVDLERAITDPRAIFGNPATVVENRQLNGAFRKRILHLRKHNVRVQVAEESEGGPARTTIANVLPEISAAKLDLAAQSLRELPAQPTEASQ